MAVSIELVALGRMAFGPRPGDVEALRKRGLADFVEEQLHPDDATDPDPRRQLEISRLHIEYADGKNDKGEITWKGLKQDRPLTSLAQPIKEIWKLAKDNIAGEEKYHPLAEVKAAAWIRAVHSRWQLREVLVDFWHNHFNVNTGIDNERAAIAFGVYDRETIRRHALGNFRQMLEAVATSVPMLLYLNNSTSKASPANENYARELFELHTLGAGAYFNHLYNRWRDVPGAVEAKPIGYIDQDVYEAARAFTGWTIADGSDSGRGDELPNTGEFYYYAGWHDPYQKRVLGVEFDPNTPPLADGRHVLDLVANHPATAQHVCTKLCRRLVAEEAPASLVQAAMQVFTANAQQPDQIARVVRTILISKEFAATWGKRVKKPFELVASFLRTTGAEVRFTGEGDDSLLGLLDGMGQYLFAWPTPAGHPESGAHWTGSGAMLARWNAMVSMTNDDVKPVRLRLMHQTPATATTWRQICRYWVDRIIGQELSADSMSGLVSWCANGQNPDDQPDLSDKALLDRINGLVAMIAMLPEFQVA